MAVLDVKYTSNITHKYDFSWTIDNFSNSRDLLREPFIPRIPGFPEPLFIELHYTTLFGFNEYSLKLSLVDSSVQDRDFSVFGRISLRKTDDNCLKAVSLNDKFQRRVCLLQYIYMSNLSAKNKHEFSKELNLLDDKLVVKGELSISCYDVESAVSCRIVNDESQAFGELSEDLKTMYESGHSSDITFSVGEETLRAHKIVLRSRSEVFANMFDSDMSESNSNEVVIEDADFHAFNCFLRFLYTGEVEDKKCDTILSLYSLAHKYQVKSLYAICSSLLCNSLTTDSACSVLMLSNLHGDEKLKRFAKDFIRHHLFQIAGTTEWVELVTSNPQLIKDVLE